MRERWYPEMEGMSEEKRGRYLRGLERLERRTLQAASPMLVAIYEAADGRDRAALISAVELFFFSLGPLLETYLPEARENLAEDTGREAKPSTPIGKPGEVVKVGIGELRRAPWWRWIDKVFPQEQSDE